MKTTLIRTIRGLVPGLLALAFLSISTQGIAGSRDRAAQDSAFKAFSGKVIDNETRKPLVFANVYLIGSSIGTVSNSEGEFIIKVPVSEWQRKVGFSCIGFKNVEIPLSELKDKENMIRLEQLATTIDEAVIRTEDPLRLLQTALKNIHENYSPAPEMQVGFYRETVKQNRNYVAVAEAVLDVYKAPYTNTFDYDRVRVYKGRKSEDVKKMDTLMFKLQGGPRTSFLLDVVKNPGSLFSDDYIGFYNFQFAGFISIDGRDNYRITFTQKPEVQEALYKGTIYLDIKNLAFTRVEFAYSDQALTIADNELVRKKPIDMKIDVLGANYLINYRVLDNKWYLNHVRSELVFKCNWKKKRYNATYTTALEMVVTDRSAAEISKAKYKDQAKMNDVFADQVSYYRDENFWGEYNYIKPDESIESVINRLSRKLKWQSIGE
jgi:hypothetical protein